MNTASTQLLIETKQLLQNPINWGKGAMASDAVGNQVTPTSPDAVEFCIEGGLRHCGLDYAILRKPNTIISEAFKHLRRTRPDQNLTIAQNNDGERMRHRDILTWLDNAIKNSQKDEN